MLAVVLLLYAAAALRLLDGTAHRVGNRVGVHDHLPGYVPCRPPARLDQGTLRTEKPFLVCVQDRHKRHFRYVQPFPEEVDADQGVEFSHPQITDYIDPLQRVDVGMEIPHPDPQPFVVGGEIFRHSLGQSRDQHTLSHPFPFPDFAQQVIHLSLYRPHHNLRIH